MTTTAYLSLTGRKQGAIKGDVTARGREGSISLLSVGYEVSVPFDPATGKPTGKRQHKPVVITKLIDEASPNLIEALVTNEILTQVKIDFWQSDPESAAPYFSISLTNAIINDMSLSRAAEPISSEIERLEFIYQRIVWTSVASGGVAQDDWNTPV